MKLYEIRLCKHSELNKLREFINLHWSNNHILCKSDSLFFFQHGDGTSGYFDFAVAENLVTHEFDGVYGFIFSRRYDVSGVLPSIIWGAIWKIRDDIKNPEIGKVGFALLKYITKLHADATYAVLGMSDINFQISKAFHFVTGELNHYYILNNHFDHFHIALPDNSVKKHNKREDTNNLIEIRDVSIYGTSLRNDLNPYKNTEYFINRYDKHPIYKYRFLGIFESDILRIVMVVRKVQSQGASILRIIDLIGSKVSLSCYDAFQKFLLKEDAEYIDCLNWGIENDFFKKLGFSMICDTDKTTIPDHFEPFEQVNVPLRFAYNSVYPIIIFKGDGDQDRPSIL